MPAGITCTNGTCLLSLTTDGGFGNCVVVSQSQNENRATAGVKAASNATTNASASANVTRKARKRDGRGAVCHIHFIDSWR